MFRRRRDRPEGVGGADELVVGEARMVRTFRLGDDGGLYPVNSAAPWTAGWNTAVCGRGRAHTPPAVGCRCGFYLYADPAFVLCQPPAGQVLAVASVRGLMEAGARGARAHQARVDAVWLGPKVGGRLALAVADRYPAVALYRDRTELLAAHPLSVLPGFRPARLGVTARRRMRAALFVFLAAVGVVGSWSAAAGAPTHRWAGAALTCLSAGLLSAAAALTVAGFLTCSSITAFAGMSAVAWLLPAGPGDPAATAAFHGLVAVTVGWVALVWWRAATPGRRIVGGRLDTAYRRWRRRLTEPR